jgi:hypothetical protein
MESGMTEEEREKAVDELCSQMVEFTKALDTGDSKKDYAMPGIDGLAKAIVASDLLPLPLVAEFKGIIREMEFARMTAAIAVISLLSNDLDEATNSSEVIFGISKRMGEFATVLATTSRMIEQAATTDNQGSVH